MPMPDDFISRLLDAFNTTIIPDGDNQPRFSNGEGSTLVLGPGDETSVKDDPVVTLDDDNANFLAYGDAQADGNAPAVSISGDDGLLAVFPGGSVTGDRDGVELSGDNGLVLNAGKISGGVNGVRLLGDNGLLANFGKITSDSRAVDILGTNVVVENFGKILGTDDQRNGTIYADNEAENIAIVNHEGALVDAGRGNNGAGVSLELGDAPGQPVDASLVNHGRIVGRGEAPEGENTNGDGIRLFSGVEGGGTAYRGDLINSGEIVSNSARGVEISDGLVFSGEIQNTGLIFGETDGLYIGDAEHSATVENHGLIQSDSRAVNIDGEGVDLENHGRIVGTGDQRNGTVYSDGTADDYLIFNHAGGVIDAGRGNDGSALSLQTGDRIDDSIEAAVFNDGLIRGRGDSTTGNDIGDGIRIFSNFDDVVLNATIENTGTIRASRDSDAAVGIRVEDGVDYQGALSNFGRIVANEVAIDASEAGGRLQMLNEGVILGDVVLTDFDDRYDGALGRVNGVVKGGAGNDELIGGQRKDRLEGGADDDALTGNGGADVFIFSEKAVPSNDTVTDFQNGRDQLDVSDFGFDGLGDIDVEARGDDVLLTFDENNTVLLEDTLVSQITTDDFIF